MPSAPRVSVIIAAYNWSTVLRYAITSVLRQTLDDFELWVVGDACTDDSEEVAQSFGDPRVHWHNLERNSGGQWAPNNAGAVRARGEYIAYLGQDDLWHPRHLEQGVALARASGADVVYALAAMICPDFLRYLSGLTASGELTREDFVVPSSLLHRARLFEEVGPWPAATEVALPVDMEWQQRLWTAGKTFRGTGRLTVFKFPSLCAPGGYRERRSDQQAEYTRRMLEEPDFIERELLAVARAAANRPLTRLRVSDVEGAPKGFWFRNNRRRRGLEEYPEPMLPLDAADGSQVFLRLLQAPERVALGESFAVAAELENRGLTALRMAPPNPVQLSYHWLDASGAVIVYDGLRSELFAPLAPGATAACRIRVEAPARSGRFLLRVAAVQEYVRWHDEAGAAGDVWIDVVERATPR